MSIEAKSNDNRIAKLLKNKVVIKSLIRGISTLDYLSGKDLDDIRESDIEFTLPFGQRSYSDTLYYCENNNTFLIFIDTQGYTDCTMMWRVEEYSAAIRAAYFAKKHNDGNKQNVINNESFDIPTVIPIVFYNGVSAWKIPKSCEKGLNEFEIVYNSPLKKQSYFLIDINSCKDKEIKLFPKPIGFIFELEKLVVESKMGDVDISGVTEFACNYVDFSPFLTPDEKDILDTYIKLTDEEHDIGALIEIKCVTICRSHGNMAPIDMMFTRIKEVARQEVMQEIREELRQEAREELRQEAREELRQEAREELRQEIREELRQEARETLLSRIVNLSAKGLSDDEIKDILDCSNEGILEAKENI